MTEVGGPSYYENRLTIVVIKNDGTIKDGISR